MKTHILIATAKDDVELIKKASSTKRVIDWPVPKSAQPSDNVLFFVKGKGLIGSGVILDNPVKLTDGHWKGKFSSKVTEFISFETPISEQQLNETFPNWRWLKYPRNYTTSLQGIADQLKIMAANLPHAAAVRKKPPSIPDRNDPIVAGKIIEHLIPDEKQRAPICAHLASYWQYAKRNYPTNSFITLAKDFIRLNVGMVESFVIAKDHILVVIDKTLSEPSAPGHYKSHSDALPIRLTHREYTKRAASFQAAIYSMINKLGVTHKHPSAFKAHSSGLAVFLEENHPYDITIDFPEQINEQFYEGSKTQVTVNHYERDGKARSACLRHYASYDCQICKINFLEEYGLIGKDFIHVHHLKPVSSIGTNGVIKPEEDLIPVCPNCHAMLHMRKPEPYSAEELRKMIGQ